MQALGFVEISGVTAAVDALDIMCKAADVEISQAVLDQAVRYNSIVGAHYLMLTNGLKMFCFESLGEGRYARLNELPKL